jgi:hypothetical protein
MADENRRPLDRWLRRETFLTRSARGRMQKKAPRIWGAARGEVGGASRGATQRCDSAMPSFIPPLKGNKSCPSQRGAVRYRIGGEFRGRFVRASAARSLPTCGRRTRTGGKDARTNAPCVAGGSDAPSPCARKRGRACLSRPIFCDFAPTPASGAARMSCPPPHTGGATILSRLGLDQSRRASRKPETNPSETRFPSHTSVLLP